MVEHGSRCYLWRDFPFHCASAAPYGYHCLLIFRNAAVTMKSTALVCENNFFKRFPARVDHFSLWCAWKHLISFYMRCTVCAVLRRTKKRYNCSPMGKQYLASVLWGSYSVFTYFSLFTTMMYSSLQLNIIQSTESVLHFSEYVISTFGTITDFHSFHYRNVVTWFSDYERT